MRAKEFIAENGQPTTINIPITITIPAGGGGPAVSTAAPASEELPDEPTYVSPLQQELELKKQQGGKKSPVINQIVSDDGAYSEDDEAPQPNKMFASGEMGKPQGRMLQRKFRDKPEQNQ